MGENLSLMRPPGLFVMAAFLMGCPWRRHLRDGAAARVRQPVSVAFETLRAPSSSQSMAGTRAGPSTTAVLWGRRMAAGLPW